MSRWYENWIKFMCTAHNWIIFSQHFICWSFFLPGSSSLRRCALCTLCVCVYLHLILLALHCNAFCFILHCRFRFALFFLCRSPFSRLSVWSRPKRSKSTIAAVKSVNSAGLTPAKRLLSARFIAPHNRYFWIWNCPHKKRENWHGIC